MKLLKGISEDNIKQTDTLTLVDVTGMKGHPYKRIAMYRADKTNVYDVQDQLENDFNGWVLVDSAYYKGLKHKWRFIEIKLEDGKIVPDSTGIRSSGLHEGIHDLADRLARQDPNLKGRL